MPDTLRETTTALRDLYLRDHVHMCVLERSIVFLDLKSDKYLAVPPTGVSTLSARLAGLDGFLSPSSAGAAIPDDSDIIADLIRRGLVTVSAQKGKPATPVSISSPSRAIPPGLRTSHRHPVRLRLAVPFFTCWLYTSASLSVGGLTRVVRSLGALRTTYSTSVPPSDYQAILEVLETFRHLRTATYTAHDACLFNCLVLTRFLHYCRLQPTFIIGVRAKPFSAHAWVQIADVVIDDRLEAVQNFVPILSV